LIIYSCKEANILINDLQIWGGELSCGETRESGPGFNLQPFSGWLRKTDTPGIGLHQPSPTWHPPDVYWLEIQGHMVWIRLEDAKWGRLFYGTRY